MEGGLDLRRHDAAQWHIIVAVVGLTVMFHPQSEQEGEGWMGKPDIVSSPQDKSNLV